ncbi:MAG: von Willebrand factor type A domain-containing protein, partial [Anaerolineales bacterium]|nr:von Willebrand factor type A domain-containing protein [Anaerolineales bacterium]
MKRYPFIIILLAISALFLAACSSAEPETVQVEVTRVVTETVEVEGEPVIADVVVESEIIEYSAEEEAAAEAPIAAAPPADSEPIAPLPTPSPMGTAVPPRDTFFQDYGVNPYILTQADDLSTFSLDVDTGAYTIARRYINEGLQPPQDAIRVEEFVNSFD